MRRARLGFVVGFVVAACVPSYDFSPGQDAGQSDAGADVTANPPADAGADAPAPADAFVFDSGYSLSFVECHVDTNTYALCPFGRQACCGVFAVSPDFCVGFPDVDAACTSDAGPTAIVACDDPRQCTDASVCCGANVALDPSGSYTAIGCAAATDCVAPSVVLCGNAQGGMVDGGCPSGQTCSGHVDDYYFCK